MKWAAWVVIGVSVLLVVAPVSLVVFIWTIIAPAVVQQVEEDPCSIYPATSAAASTSLAASSTTLTNARPVAKPAGALPAPGEPRRASRTNPPLTIPTRIKALYVKAATRYRLAWALLAGVGMAETGHGHNNRTSSAGARGLMQFMPATFASFSVDGDGDGRTVITNDADSIFAAANYLRHSGATATGGVRRALFAYNRAGWYVNDVLFYAAHYAGDTATITASDCDPSSSLTDTPVPPGPDGPCPPSGSAAERRLTPHTLRMLRCVKKAFPWVQSMGGVGPRPNVSDHPSGHAVDFMTPRWNIKAGNARGWQMAHWLQKNAANLKVKYIIFDNKVWRSYAASRGWARYLHPNGSTNPTTAHEDHVHVSTY